LIFFKRKTFCCIIKIAGKIVITGSQFACYQPMNETPDETPETPDETPDCDKDLVIQTNNNINTQ